MPSTPQITSIHAGRCRCPATSPRPPPSPARWGLGGETETEAVTETWMAGPRPDTTRSWKDGTRTPMGVASAPAPALAPAAAAAAGTTSGCPSSGPPARALCECMGVYTSCVDRLGGFHAHATEISVNSRIIIYVLYIQRRTGAPPSSSASASAAPPPHSPRRVVGRGRIQPQPPPSQPACSPAAAPCRGLQSKTQWMESEGVVSFCCERTVPFLASKQAALPSFPPLASLPRSGR